MKTINLKSYAKINLAIDVLGKLPSGYHEVSMIMQQIELHDKICVKWIPRLEEEETGQINDVQKEIEQENDAQEDVEIKIEINSNKRYLPRDRRNLAYRAAELMIEKYDIYRKFGEGKVRIDIKKQIPVGAGLGGGSANCATVMHALSRLWNLRISTKELCDIGATLGSDVPFCIMGQAGQSAALVSGTGTEITHIKGIDVWIVLSKPPISVSTEAVYKGFSEIEDKSFERPDVKQLVTAMEEKNFELIYKNIINVLENFTLKAYASAMYTKSKMVDETKPAKAVMSGSGPTIIGFYENKESAKAAYEKLIDLNLNKETFLTKTQI